jgi:hypothetical protein
LRNQQKKSALTAVSARKWARKARRENIFLSGAKVLPVCDDILV